MAHNEPTQAWEGGVNLTLLHDFFLVDKHLRCGRGTVKLGWGLGGMLMRFTTQEDRLDPTVAAQPAALFDL